MIKQIVSVSLILGLVIGFLFLVSKPELIKPIIEATIRITLDAWIWAIEGIIKIIGGVFNG